MSRRWKVRHWTKYKLNLFYINKKSLNFQEVKEDKEQLSALVSTFWKNGIAISHHEAKKTVGRNEPVVDVADGQKIMQQDDVFYSSALIATSFSFSTQLERCWERGVD